MKFIQKEETWPTFLPSLYLPRKIKSQITHLFVNTINKDHLEVCVVQEVRSKWNVSEPLRACPYIKKGTFMKKRKIINELFTSHGNPIMFYEKMKKRKESLTAKLGWYWKGLHIENPQPCNSKVCNNLKSLSVKLLSWCHFSCIKLVYPSKNVYKTWVV